ncbi:hypothetical protein G6514_007987 [Epicoccum nigrum]|nr:hypothetical protein G6514_007987 [Epicoccum nigrum]
MPHQQSPSQCERPAPRRSTRTRKPSTRLVCTLAPAALPSPPPRLRLINDEPVEPWPPRAEDLPPSLRHLVPKSASRAKASNAKKAVKQAATKQMLTPSRTPSSGASHGNGSEGTTTSSPPSSPSPEEPIAPRWSERGAWAPDPYMYAESAERDSLAREGEIRRAWVVNEPARLARETRWKVDDRVRKRKLQFMLADFRTRERGLEEGGGSGV